jgi:TetR/AcrR family transcriptional repressor of nem operon
MRKPAETRRKIVESAMLLFAVDGFERTSLLDIAADAGVRGGSIYHFFGTKRELLEAVLETYLEALVPHVMAPAFARSDDPIERAFAVLDDYRERVVSTGFRYRCPIGSLALEVAGEYPSARALIDRNFAAWRGAIRAQFEAARPDFLPGVDLAGLAGLFLTVMEGAVMQSVAEASSAPFDASIAHLRTYVTTLLRKRKRS